VEVRRERRSEERERERERERETTDALRKRFGQASQLPQCERE